MAKKHRHEEQENLERWLVSYADFITLLFAFFTVLYALSMSDKAKYKNAVENIQRAFLSAGGVFALKGSPFVPFERPADKGSAIPPSASDAGSHSKTDGEALAKVTEQIRGLFTSTTGLSMGANQVSIAKSDEGYKIRLGENILFKPGSDRIRKEHIPFLYEIGKRLAQLGYPVQIEGHTDKLPSTDEHANWELSLARSYNIVRFLVTGAGFPEGKISIIGYGDTQPINSNETEEGRAKNRRVEIAIMTPNHSMDNVVW